MLPLTQQWRNADAHASNDDTTTSKRFHVHFFTHDFDHSEVVKAAHQPDCTAISQRAEQDPRPVSQAEHQNCGW